MEKLIGMKLRSFAVLVCGLLLGTSQTLADTSVWSVSSGDNILYLGGTVHLLRPGDYPLPSEFEEVYQASSELIFETDIGSMNDLSVQAQMLQQLTYSDERSLFLVTKPIQRLLPIRLQPACPSSCWRNSNQAC